MKQFVTSALALLAALAPVVQAQTHTDCDPRKQKGCPNMQALGGNATFDLTKGGIPEGSKVWKNNNAGTIGWNPKGATFTVERSGDAPTVQSQFYLFFGRFEVIMQAAPGQGIVSSAIMQSEDLDEIDWEFLGGKTQTVYTNFFGKGNMTIGEGKYSRGINYTVPSAPQSDFHNYTVDWTRERIQFWMDGNLLRTLAYNDPSTLGGSNYPQTPMNIRLGSWAGGDKSKNSQGTVDWAGGETDFKQGPFTMTVQSVYAIDYTTAAEYSWENMDESGSADKVKVILGKSKVLQEIQHPSGIRNRWKALPQGAKIGIIGGALGIVALLLIAMTFCCIKQRRAGRREHAALLAEEQREQAELQEYKKQMQQGRFGFGNTPHTPHRF